MAWWNDLADMASDSMAKDSVSDYGNWLGDYTSNIDWSDTADDVGFWGSAWNSAKSWFGGGGTGQQSGASNIFGAMLGGLGGAAGAYMDEKAVEKASKESRKSMDYQAQLTDYYKQQDKARKRVALDTYGQFSLMDRYAPGRSATPPVTVPAKPAP